MLFDLFRHANSAFVLVRLPQPVACGVFFAPPLLNNGNPVDGLGAVNEKLHNLFGDVL